MAIAVAARSLVRRQGWDRASPEPVLADAVPASDPVPIGMTAARLTIAFRPVRAGLNLLSATVEGEITLTNAGDRPAEAIRVEARLLSAHAEQDVEIAAVLNEPAARPIAAPFDLGPGESRRVRVVVALLHEAIRRYFVGGREMFVPMITVNAQFRSGEASRQVGQAFAVGNVRADSAKLAPFWLDAGSQMHVGVATRLHGELVER